jgi:hypothetical protein
MLFNWVEFSVESKLFFRFNIFNFWLLHDTLFLWTIHFSVCNFSFEFTCDSLSNKLMTSLIWMNLVIVKVYVVKEKSVNVNELIRSNLIF